MTGEMCREEVTRESYPLHFAIAKAFRGTVEPFDQYQGPYVRTRRGKFWIQSYVETCDHGHSHDTGFVQVYNESTGRLSEPFLPYWQDQRIGDAHAVDAARETLG